MMAQRKSWPLEDWPAADRSAWIDATSLQPLFGIGGSAAHWTPKTQRTVLKAYGRWLAYLDSVGELSTTDLPAGRIKVEQIRTYWKTLKGEVAPVTVAGLITNLGEAARVMWPDHDFNWLKTAARKLVARATPNRDKISRTLPAEKLLSLGMRLMEEAESYRGKQGVKCAARYRMGLMITLLTASGLRRANFTELNLGTSFKKVGERFGITLSEQETKGCRPHELLLPSEMTPHIDRYLVYWRPLLLGDRTTNRLWITWLGNDLTEGGLYSEILKTTYRELGVRINPHAFRDSIATTVALKDPAHVRMLKAILQHRSLETTNRYYNMAGQAEAVQRLQESILSRRRTAKRYTKSRRAV